MILQKMVFTTPMEGTQALCFQGEKADVDGKILVIEKGGSTVKYFLQFVFNEKMGEIYESKKC